ncbi:fatty acid desaturase [Mucilaginibacter paludis]|uniref:Fatty acid desaturase n=1 Tax=Mucilaginibacter paludis DSM 18603 TaxID=714943 RepID=H1Y1T1_9SPHI|nr:fatty acid desaturase [Mucilaginibacter paludis]EHQ24740.1 fatty acid desaturase [Mucilaginibacter paludis DSM 18603]
MAKRTDFNWSDESEPHKKRTKKIITEHPEIRQLIGRNPYTMLVILLCVGIQIGLAIWLKDASWWLVLLVSYAVGAFASHTLFICIHECAHNLVFKNRTLNTLAGIFANLPQGFASSVSFQKYHLKHHSFQGVAELDADMPFGWEARLINNRWFGKSMWLLFFPVFQLLRPFRLKEINLLDAWTVVNWLAEIVFMGGVIYFFGAKAVMYMIFSFFFSVGLHPLGARWVQEHYLTHGDHQETKSYYGVLNVVNLNVGYHNEHHDFPSVPWNKLPQIKKVAGEHYETLGYHTSYTVLLFQFLFNRDLSLFSRTKRSNRGGKLKASPVTATEEVVL